MKVSQNTYVVSPAAGWGHHPLNYKKVSVGRFVKGGHSPFILPLTKMNARTTLPRRMMSNHNGSPYPNQQYMRTKKGGSWLWNRLSLSARFSN